MVPHSRNARWLWTLLASTARAWHAPPKNVNLPLRRRKGCDWFAHYNPTQNHKGSGLRWSVCVVVALRERGTIIDPQASADIGISQMELTARVLQGFAQCLCWWITPRWSGASGDENLVSWGLSGSRVLGGPDLFFSHCREEGEELVDTHTYTHTRVIRRHKHRLTVGM